MLATPNILTRPWCLLEIYIAATKDVPVLWVPFDAPGMNGFEKKKAGETQLIDRTTGPFRLSLADYIAQERCGGWDGAEECASLGRTVTDLRDALCATAAFIANIETSLDKVNPGGLATVKELIAQRGVKLDAFKEAIIGVLKQKQGGGKREIGIR